MALAWDITLGSWVEKMKVVPSRRFISRMRSMMFPPVFESRLAVGSSASTSGGLATSARATATRCRWPPESSLGRWREWSASPTASRSAFTLRRRSSEVMRPCRSSGNSTFWKTVSTATRLKVWKMKPMWSSRSRVSARSVSFEVSSPSTRTVPGAGHVDAADEVEERGLAAPGGAGDGEELAPLDHEVHVAERVHLGLAELVDLGDVHGLDDGFWHAGQL